MNCIRPYMQGVLAFGCGQCIPCRIGRARKWTHRMMLESFLHPASCFITLTYDDDNIPEHGSLRKRDLQLFWPRLYKQVGPFRYYGVGEYGRRTLRPHYHGILFGLPPTIHTDLVRAWPKSDPRFVHVAECNALTIAYTAGYITGKITDDDSHRDAYKNREREFALMSRRPGIGADAAALIARSYSDESACRDFINRGDVPDFLKHGRGQMPLDRFMKGKIHEALGYESEAIRSGKLERYVEEMRALFVSAQARAQWDSERTQAALNTSKRHAVFNSRDKV